MDVLTGKQRRVHRDIDLDFDAARTVEVMALVHQYGWRIETDWRPCRVELYSPEHGYADFHPFELLPDGKARQADLNGSWWHFDADFFSEAAFAGRRIPCISAKGQKVFHSGYELREKDRIDLANLERYAKL